MKHIVLITTSFPDETLQNGQESAGGFVEDFAKSLSKYANVTVVAPGRKNKLEKNERLRVLRFPVDSLPLSLLKVQKPGSWIKIFKTLRAGKLAVENVAKENEVDHIFALWALPSGFWAYKIGKKYSIPYSIWALGSDIWSLGKLPIVKIVLRKVLRGSVNRFADGYILADDVENLSHLDCHFLPSSRELTFGKEKDLSVGPPYKLAFLGRYHPNKGIDLLVDSLKLLQKQDWTQIDSVQICGGGPLLDEVEKGVLDLQDRGHPVTLGGYLDKKQAQELFLWADYILLPSRIESIPVIFSDAMQTNCPLISMPVGDLPRLLNTYRVGVLAQAVTSEAFANAIRQALCKAPIIWKNRLNVTKNEFSVAQSAKKLFEVLKF